MNKRSQVLLERDPKAFMEVVMNDDAAARIANLNSLDDLVVCETLRHGIFNDPRNLPDLVEFYNEVFLKAPVDRRRKIYRHVVKIVPQLGTETASAVVPFMLLDSDTGVVSTATIDYASLAPLVDNEPMTRPRDVVSMYLRKLPRNRGAVYGGLLCLGDPRVCAIIRPLRRMLSSDEVGEVTQCFSGVPAKCAIEFYLDWLEELVDRRDYDGELLFGNVVAGLFRIAEAPTSFIVDGLRPFPVPTEDGAKWPEIIHIDRQKYAQSIEARLLRLEMDESPPRIVPFVIRAFGLTPRSPESEIAPR